MSRKPVYRQKRKDKSQSGPSPVSADSPPEAISNQIDKNLLDAKEVEYYSVLVQNWFNTRMEKDRSLLTLSSAGIALTITLLTTVGTKFKLEIWLYLLSVASFLITILLSISVFNNNAKLLENLINKADSYSENRKLELFDRIILATFISGIIFLLIVGVSSSYNKIREAENHHEQLE